MEHNLMKHEPPYVAKDLKEVYDLYHSFYSDFTLSFDHDGVLFTFVVSLDDMYDIEIENVDWEIKNPTLKSWFDNCFYECEDSFIGYATNLFFDRLNRFPTYDLKKAEGDALRVLCRDGGVNLSFLGFLDQGNNQSLSYEEAVNQFYNFTNK